MLTRICFALLVLLTVPTIVAACLCGVSPFSCGDDWKRGDVIFVGTVKAKISRGRVPLANSPGYYVESPVTYRFQVAETLRGPNTDGRELVVETGVGHGDCGYLFETGKEYLVYANTYENRLTTSICTGTQPKVMVGALLRQLRSLRDGRPTDSLFGTIGTPQAGARRTDFVERKTLAGVQVRLLGSNKRRYSTTTDSEGIYSFSLLPPDKYSMEVDLPAGLSTWQQHTGKPFIVQIWETPDLRGCRVDVVALPDGRISGRVVNIKSKGLTGFVSLVPVGQQVVNPECDTGFPGSATENGAFTVFQVPPGKYQLLFYPNVGGRIIFTNQRTYTDVVEIGFGEHIKDIRFKIPPTHTRP